MPSLAEVSKAVRVYDPESGRQRRHGMATGAAAAGAAGLGASAARGLERTGSGRKTRIRLRRVDVYNDPKATGTPAQAYSRTQAGYKKPPRFVGPMSDVYTNLRVERSRNAKASKEATRALARRSGAKAAGAVGLAGLATALYRRGESSQNRRWT